MGYRRSGVVWLCAAALTVLSANGFAQPLDAFVIRDVLDRAYGPQLLSRELSAAEGEALPEAVVLRGPTGQLPVQVSEIEYWPDGKTLKTARIHFITSFRPLQSSTFTVSSEPKVASQPLDTDLQLKEFEEGVEVTTSKFGARFPLGRRRFADPVPAADVPAPVAALRLADGTWCGGSEWYGAKRIVAFESTLTGRGPVYGEVRLRYRFDDGVVLDMRARLAAGDSQFDWRVAVTPYDAEAAVKQVVEPWPEENPLAPREECLRAGWRLMLNPGLEKLSFQVRPEFGENRWGVHEWQGSSFSDAAVDVSVAQEPAGLLVNLVPWNDWWNSSTKTELTFATPDRGQVYAVRTLDAHAWVEPASRGTFAPWGNRRMRQQWIPLVRGDDGSAYLQIGLSPGFRRLRFGGAGVEVGLDLDRLSQRVLDWPGGQREHPRLYLSGDELRAVQRRASSVAAIRPLVAAAGKPGPLPALADNAAVGAWLLSGDRRVAATVGLTERLHGHLALFGDFDRMRSTFQLCGLYDAAMTGDLLTVAERRIARARMASLAYLIADAETWSMERGYCSGNLNMSVAHVLNQGILACLLSDHPRSGEWADAGLDMLEMALDKNVGPAGEWPESIANYASVSVSALLPLAIAARSAGWDDFVDDTRMKRLLLFLAKQYTPPDPRGAENIRQAISVLPPVGRGGARGRNGLPGLMASATAVSDPAYSAALQWTWMRSGSPPEIPDARLGGWEHVVLDRTIPARNPGWTFDVFPRSGGIIRRGIGTPHEWYVPLLADPADAFPSEFGGLPIVFAKGAPVIARFSGGYAEREELFVNRVIPSRPRGDKEFRMKHFYHDSTGGLIAAAGLPGAAYLEGDFQIEGPHFVSHESTAFDRMVELPEWPGVEKSAAGPISWKRQLLVQRDDDPAGPGTIFLRDSVVGGQPTSWQTWFLSDGIGPAVGRSVDPGTTARIQPVRELQGHHFRAKGQFGVDCEIFVAEPRETRRQTVRWGRSYDYSPLNKLEETMDLLHLQRGDDGAYVVAIHPRRKDDSVPDFASLADGRVVRVHGPHGVEYGFLSEDDADVMADDVRFRGRAAVFSERSDSVRVTLASKGGVQTTLHGCIGDEYSLEVAATDAVDVLVSADDMVVTLPAVEGRMSVRLTVPPEWQGPDDCEGLSIKREGEFVRINATLPRAAVRFRRSAG
jgi:hypothetical protein